MPVKPVRLAATASLAVFLGGCLPPPSMQDGSSGGKTLQQRVADLETELAQLKKAQEKGQDTSSGVQQGLENLAMETESLRQELRGQKGNLEVVQHRVDQLSDRQRRLYEDMDARLRNLESGGAAGGQQGDPSVEQTATDTEAADAVVAAESAQEAYDIAFARIEGNEYEQGAAALQAFLKAYPDSGLASNARYWLGEAHYVMREFEEALVEFNRVIQDFPDSQKAPAALLKIGFSFYELEEMENARRALNRVRERFPDSSEARLARQRLNRMGGGE